MEDEVHLAELEAYRAVLRAFSLRDNAISWTKEILITDLRKELSISNDEHRDILDQTLISDSKSSRKRHQMTVTGTKMNPSAINVTSTSHKRYRTGNTTASVSKWNPSSAEPLRTHDPVSAVNLARHKPTASNQNLPPRGNAEHAITSNLQHRHSLIPPEATEQRLIQLANESGEPSELRNSEGSDTIRIYDTKALLEEAESILAEGEKADPTKITMVKKLLHDQERALLAGINKLTGLSGDSFDSQEKLGGE